MRRNNGRDRNDKKIVRTPIRVSEISGTWIGVPLLLRDDNLVEVEDSHNSTL